MLLSFQLIPSKGLLLILLSDQFPAAGVTGWLVPQGGTMLAATTHLLMPLSKWGREKMRSKSSWVEEITYQLLSQAKQA